MHPDAHTRDHPIPTFPMRLLLMTRPKSMTSKPPASHPGSEIKGFLLRSETRGFFSAKNDRTVGQTWASIAIKKTGCKWVITIYTFFCFFVALVCCRFGNRELNLHVPMLLGAEVDPMQRPKKQLDRKYGIVFK